MARKYLFFPIHYYHSDYLFCYPTLVAERVVGSIHRSISGATEGPWRASSARRGEPALVCSAASATTAAACRH